VLRTHEHLQVVRSCEGDESATFTWLALSIRLEDPVKLEEPGEQE
jgi:hypothetical protein